MRCPVVGHKLVGFNSTFTAPFVHLKLGLGQGNVLTVRLVSPADGWETRPDFGEDSSHIPPASGLIFVSCHPSKMSIPSGCSL